MPALLEKAVHPLAAAAGACHTEAVSMLWMSIRARWRRAFAPSLAVALLIGVVGGFVLASVAAARRVEGAYQTLIREIDPSDLW